MTYGETLSNAGYGTAAHDQVCRRCSVLLQQRCNAPAYGKVPIRDRVPKSMHANAYSLFSYACLLLLLFTKYIAEMYAFIECGWRL